MARVLITGGTGFIGPYLAAALVERGSAARALVRVTSSPRRVGQLKEMGCEIVVGDVCDFDSLTAAVEGIEVVYHLAGRTKAPSVAKFSQANAVGASLVAEACARRETPPVMVSVSSLAAAGPSAQDRPRDEDEPCCPVSHYGRSKRDGELAAARWAGQAPITIVRPPVVLGGGDADGFTIFRMIARRGAHTVPRWGRMQISLVAAADLAQGMILAAEGGARLPADSDATGEGVYFIAADQRPTYAELGRMIGRALGRSHTRVVPIPMPVMWAVGALSETIARLRNRATIVNLDKYREAAAGHWTCSAARIRDQLGFRPVKTLEERLEEAAQWYREAGWL